MLLTCNTFILVHSTYSQRIWPLKTAAAVTPNPWVMKELFIFQASKKGLFFFSSWSTEFQSSLVRTDSFQLCRGFNDYTWGPFLCLPFSHIASHDSSSSHFGASLCILLVLTQKDTKVPQDRAPILSSVWTQLRWIVPQLNPWAPA